MTDLKVKTIRALDRGLEVLHILQTSSAMSLHDLHRATGLPKATLSRILKTLTKRGLVWRRIADEAYLPSYTLREYAPHFDIVHHLVEVSSPILETLCQRVSWPSILAVPRLDYMEVIETNSSRAYFDHIHLGPLGYRINMVRSATGRAYLAFCAPSERSAILDRMASKGALGANRSVVEQVLAGIRQQGYGSREPRIELPRDEIDPEIRDGRQSIAVPILVRGRAIACLNLTWTARVASVATIARHHLVDLTAAAEAIARKLEQSFPASLEPPVLDSGETPARYS